MVVAVTGGEGVAVESFLPLPLLLDVVVGKLEKAAQASAGVFEGSDELASCKRRASTGLGVAVVVAEALWSFRVSMAADAETAIVVVVVVADLVIVATSSFTKASEVGGGGFAAVVVVEESKGKRTVSGTIGPPRSRAVVEFSGSCWLMLSVL